MGLIAFSVVMVTQKVSSWLLVLGDSIGVVGVSHELVLGSHCLVTAPEFVILQRHVARVVLLRGHRLDLFV